MDAHTTPPNRGGWRFLPLLLGLAAVFYTGCSDVTAPQAETLPVSEALMAVIGMSGAQWISPPPSSVKSGDLVSNTFIRVFQESSAVTLAAAVAVDITAPGTYTTAPASTSIAAGTTVNSYLVHLDRTNHGSNQATITFDEDVVALITRSQRLIESDAALGNPTTSYSLGGARGTLEGGADVVSLSPDRRTLTVTMAVDPPKIDQIRVLTQAAVAFPPGGKVGTGGGHSCVIIDGTVECFGANGQGQAPASRSALSGTFIGVTLGLAHTCALRDDGVAECWGSDDHGQAPPTRAASTGHFVQLHAGQVKTCGLRSDGLVECWGNENFTRSATGGHFTRISVGNNHFCALTSEGVADCWGFDGAGQAPGPRSASGGLSFTEVAAGCATSCALRSDGVIECWGADNHGQGPPIKEAAIGVFTHVQIGQGPSCAVRDDGVVECWGLNNHGQAPSSRNPLTGSFTEVNVAISHTCARRDDGLVECWGANGSGEAPSLYPANNPPTITAGGPYAGDQGASITLDWAGHDSDGDALTFTWDLGDGTAGSGPTLPGAHTWADDGIYTITVSVSDGSESASDQTTATVSNVAPTGIFANDGPVDEGTSFTLSITDVIDGPADMAAGFTYAFDCGAGYSASGSQASASCPTTDVATLTVRGTVTDKDGASSEYSGTVDVLNVAPTLTGIPDAELFMGESYVATGSFTDPGDDTFTATVTYEGTSETLALDGYAFSLDHSYGTAGTYIVTVTVTDDDGGVGTTQATVVVLSAVEAAGAVTESITDAVTSGEISETDAEPLITTMEAVTQSLERENGQAALGQLGSLDNKVDAQVKSGRITEETGATIQEGTARLKESITQGGTTSGNGGGKGKPGGK